MNLERQIERSLELAYNLYLFEQVRLDKYVQDLQKVTLKDVKRVLKKLLDGPVSIKVSATEGSLPPTFKSDLSAHFKKLFKRDLPS